jgi:hypothetical protein
MRRTCTVLASVAVAALGGAGLATPAQAKWKKLDCAPTVLRGAKICLYRGTKNTHRAQGRYINNSDLDVWTRGEFWPVNSHYDIPCATAMTEAHSTSRCTRTLEQGTYHLTGHTWRGGEYLGETVTANFRFGF